MCYAQNSSLFFEMRKIPVVALCEWCREGFSYKVSVHQHLIFVHFDFSNSISMLQGPAVLTAK